MFCVYLVFVFVIFCVLFCVCHVLCVSCFVLSVFKKWTLSSLKLHAVKDDFLMYGLLLFKTQTEKTAEFGISNPTKCIQLNFLRHMQTV